MTQRSRSAIKAFFEAGDRPNDVEFGDLFDSIIFMDESNGSAGDSTTIAGALNVGGNFTLTGAGANFAMGGNFMAGSTTETATYTINAFSSHATQPVIYASGSSTNIMFHGISGDATSSIKLTDNYESQLATTNDVSFGTHTGRAFISVAGQEIMNITGSGVVDGFKTFISGSVGINQINAAASLDVKNGGAHGGETFGSGAQIAKFDGVGSRAMFLELYDSNDYAFYNDGDLGANGIVFRDGQGGLDFFYRGENIGHMGANNNRYFGFGSTFVPSYNLDIRSATSGSVWGRFYSQNAYDTGIRLQNATKNWLIYTTGNSGVLTIKDSEGSTYPVKIQPGANNNSIYINSSGRVGLGTTNVPQKLTVQGNISSSGNIYLGKKSSTAEGPTQNQLIFGAHENDSAKIYSWKPAGGTNTELYIVTADNSDDDIWIQTNGWSNTESGSLYVQVQDFNINGISTIGRYAKFDGTTGAFMLGNAAHGSNYSTLATISETDDGARTVLTVAGTAAGNTHLAYQGKDNYFSYADTGITQWRTYDGSNYSNKMRLDGSGNLGIGTASPVEKLHVAGNIKTTGTIYGASAGNADSTPTGEGYRIRHSSNLIQGGTIDPNVAHRDFLVFEKTDGNNNDPDGGIAFTNTGMDGLETVAMSIRGNGRVGVGEVSPIAKLHITDTGADWDTTTPGTVKGTIHLTPSDSDNFGNAITWGASDTGNGRSSQAGIYVRSDGSYGTKMYFATTNQYSAGSKIRMMINHNGAVGIGADTSGMTGLLQGDLILGGYSGRSAHEVGALMGGHNNIGATTSKTNPIYIIGSSYKPNESTLNNMYGVGYTHTDASFITATNNSWGMYVAADGDARIWLGASPAGDSYFNTTGNFGIGTAAPTSKLHVDGDVKIEGNLRVDQGFFNHDIVYTSGSDHNKWYKMFSFPYSTYGFNPLNIRHNEGGNSQNSNKNADIIFDFKSQGSSGQRVNINIQNYGPNPLISSSIRVAKEEITPWNGSTTSGTIHVYYKPTVQWDRTSWTILGKTRANLTWTQTRSEALIGNDAALDAEFAAFSNGTYNDVWTEHVVQNGLFIDGDEGAKTGIGTTSPDAHLHVAGASDAIATWQTTDDVWLYHQWKQSDGTRLMWNGLNNPMDKFHFNMENGLKTFVIDGPSDMKVGINTSNPAQMLDINAGHIQLDTNYAIGKNLDSSTDKYAIYPVRNNLDTIGMLGPVAPWTSALTLESDAMISFIETDNDNMVGYVDVNGSEFGIRNKIKIYDNQQNSGILISSTDNVNGMANDQFSGDSNVKQNKITFYDAPGSNDNGFIMHETSGTSGNHDKSTIHLVPSDNASGPDYVHVHSSNSAHTQGVKLYTSGILKATNDIESAENFTRLYHHRGALEGRYNIENNSTKSNPIYVIGSGYKPNESSLSSMYGIGYSHTNASFLNTSSPDAWGMYVAADGNARVFISGTNQGETYFNTDGHFGIGTDNPETALDIHNGGDIRQVETGTGQWSGATQTLKINGITSEYSQLIKYFYRGSSTTPGPTIDWQRRSDGGTYHGTILYHRDSWGWDFRTAQSNTSTSTTRRFRINKNGYVGIGGYRVDNPAYLLDVGQSGLHAARFTADVDKDIIAWHGGGIRRMTTQGGTSIGCDSSLLLHAGDHRGSYGNTTSNLVGAPSSVINAATTEETLWLTSDGDIKMFVHWQDNNTNEMKYHIFENNGCVELGQKVNAGYNGHISARGAANKAAFAVKQIVQSNSTSHEPPGIRLYDNDTENFWQYGYGYSDRLYFSWRTGTSTGNTSTNYAVNTAYIDHNTSVGSMGFTGQHFSKPATTTTLENMSSKVGYIVIADGTYENFDVAEEKGAANINEAFPRVQLSNVKNDKRVFGVISDCEDNNDDFGGSTEEHQNKKQRIQTHGAFKTIDKIEPGDERLIINSIGEGGIMVCSINGSLSNGDYISSSDIEGLGMRQDDDLLHNYTVAKITQDCNFTGANHKLGPDVVHEGVTYKTAFVGCTYHCG